MLGSGIPNTIFTRTCRGALILVSGLGTRHTDPSFRWASHDGRISSPQAGASQVSRWWRSDLEMDEAVSRWGSRLETTSPLCSPDREHMQSLVDEGGVTAGLARSNPELNPTISQIGREL